ncbi:MAG: putative flavodoxin YqcA [Sodalis sp. Fse]|nr:MAG: putative flavodoxin YqcA [Sodalis sp. Fle]UVK77486.1 MAG: putative flavodoxin YqcA [Sodalis sp. Fse]
MAQIGIFVGTVYGNALLTAKEVELVLAAQEHQVALFKNGIFEQWQTYSKEVILLITSTTGHGEIPSNIIPLFQQLKNKLNQQPALRYGIIALGDRSYDTFCGAGHRFDAMLQDQGANRIGELLKIDTLEHPNSETIACSWAKQWGALL